MNHNMKKIMKRNSLFFTKSKKIEIKKEKISHPNKQQVLIRTMFSSISAGTEMLFYTNQIHKGITVDEKIPILKTPFKYPLKYGYSVVGKIVSLGENVPKELLDTIVFVFHPHEDYFLSTIDELIIIPDDIKPIEATFLASVETAVSLVMDGAPIIGENLLIYGQGIIGLLTTNLLSLYPFNSLITVEKHPLRRKKSCELGAHKSIQPNENIFKYFKEGADLVYELSGNPKALDSAIKSTKYNGRIIIGSCYGRKKTTLSLDEGFHRSRIQIKSSQVSTISPLFLGRWDKVRRIDLCWKLIRQIKPKLLISHIIPFEKASKAYETLGKHPEKTLQIILKY